MQLDRLREETEIEIDNLQEVVNDAKGLLETFASRPLTKPEVYGAGAMLGCFYTGVENLLSRFLKYQGIPLPTGEQWHDDLLGCFKAGALPDAALRFDESTLSVLGDLRKIRHVVRNRYAHLLRWDLLKPHLENLASLVEPLATCVRTALTELEQKQTR